MPHLAPPTLITAEQKAILGATAANLRDRIRLEIAKSGRAADVFLPDRLVRKLKRF